MLKFHIPNLSKFHLSLLCVTSSIILHYAVNASATESPPSNTVGLLQKADNRHLDGRKLNGIFLANRLLTVTAAKYDTSHPSHFKSILHGNMDDNINHTSRNKHTTHRPEAEPTELLTTGQTDFNGDTIPGAMPDTNSNTVIVGAAVATTVGASALAGLLFGMITIRKRIAKQLTNPEEGAVGEDKVADADDDTYRTYYLDAESPPTSHCYEMNSTGSFDDNNEPISYYPVEHYSDELFNEHCIHTFRKDSDRSSDHRTKSTDSKPDYNLEEESNCDISLSPRIDNGSTQDSSPIAMRRHSTLRLPHTPTSILNIPFRRGSGRAKTIHSTTVNDVINKLSQYFKNEKNLFSPPVAEDCKSVVCGEVVCGEVIVSAGSTPLVSCIDWSQAFSGYDLDNRR